MELHPNPNITKTNEISHCNLSPSPSAVACCSAEEYRYKPEEPSISEKLESNEILLKGEEGVSASTETTAPSNIETVCEFASRILSAQNQPPTAEKLTSNTAALQTIQTTPITPTPVIPAHQVSQNQLVPNERNRPQSALTQENASKTTNVAEPSSQVMKSSQPQKTPNPNESAVPQQSTSRGNAPRPETIQPSV